MRSYTLAISFDFSWNQEQEDQCFLSTATPIDNVGQSLLTKAIARSLLGKRRQKTQEQQQQQQQQKKSKQAANAQEQ